MTIFSKITLWWRTLPGAERIAIGLLVLAGAIRCGIVFLPWKTLAVWFVPDDSFYYFAIARNIAHGVGSTFDGHHITNGYHPLWMLICVAIIKINETPSFVVHAASAVGALLDCVTLWFLYRILRKFLGATPKMVLAFGLVACNPFHIIAAVNGLETALVGMLFAAFFWWAMTRAEAGAWRASEVAVWGLLGGLVVLGRADYGIYVAVFFIWYLFTRRGHTIRDAALLGVTSLALVSPWFLWSYAHTHTIVQESGLAFTLVTKTLFYYKPRSMVISVVWSVNQLWSTVRLIALQTALVVPVCAALLAGFVAIIKTKGRVVRPLIVWPADKNRQLLYTVVAASALFVFVQGAIRWSARPWYFETTQIICIALFVAGITRLKAWNYSSVFRVAAVALCILSLGYFAATRLPQYPAQRTMIAAAEWARVNLPVDARVAAFNSGIHGFLSGRYVMNADGLVNHDAYLALKDRSLWQLFQKEHIQYVLDYDIALDYRYAPFFGVPNVRGLMHEEHVFEDPTNAYHGSKLRLYRMP